MAFVTRRWSLAILGISVFVSSLLGACTAPDEATGDASGAVSTADKPALTDATKKTIFQTSQGSEFLPYALVRALNVPKAGSSDRIPFLSAENLRSLRFVVDPSLPTVDGLGAGLTLNLAKDTGFVSLGFNCSACHVGEIRYQGTGGQLRSLVAYGGTNPIDLQQFFVAAGAAIKDNLTDPGFYARLVSESNRIDREMPELAAKVTDSTFDRIGMVWDLAKYLVGWDKTPEEFAAGLDIPVERQRLLLSRLYYLKGMGMDNQTPMPPAGPGRAAPNFVGKAVLFGHYGFVPNDKPSPVSSSGLFNIETSAWFHAYGNTNSVFARNVFQAFALGGVIDYFGETPTYTTSLDIDLVRKLEYAFYAVAPPAWPADAPHDAALATRGASLYKSTCASCHEPTVEKDLYTSKLVSLDMVGTDPNYATQFEQTIETPTGRTKVSDYMQFLAGKVKAQYYATNHVSPAEQLKQEDIYDATLNPTGRRYPAAYRNTGAYQARPLDGVWSTAPFLHNGSVPTLDDLLKPASQRPKKFYMGHNDYDMSRVGLQLFTTPHPDLNATFLFDTTLSGNSNAGHEFGTDLPADDKRALIEFLKGFGAGKARPTRFAAR